LNVDPSIDTLGECNKFQFVVNYAPSPPPVYASLPLASSPTPPSSPPHKKPIVSPFYKPILKWAKKSAYSFEFPSETPQSQET